MKSTNYFKLLYLFSFFFTVSKIYATIPKSDSLVILHTVSTTEMNTITSPEEGSLIFNTDDQEVYERTSNTWNKISSDGSETKIVAGNCMNVTGAGTTLSPYIIDGTIPSKTQATAKRTCKQILEAGCAVGDGIYWINPNGGSRTDAFKVYCDMTNDGGGWTRIEYANNLTHEAHFSGGDARRWLPNNFTFTLTDTQINNIRAASTEGKQTYRGTCDGVIHYLYQTSDYSDSFGFRFHDGSDTAPFGLATYAGTNITVSEDGCWTNNNNSLDTVFNIVDIRVPIINVNSKDNSYSERFGSPLKNNPAWLR